MIEEQLRDDLEQALTLPRSRECIDAFCALIRQADQIQSLSLRKRLSWRCVSEQMGYGDQGKVFLLVAEYVALCEELEQTHVAYGDHELILMAWPITAVAILTDLFHDQAKKRPASLTAAVERRISFPGWNGRSIP